MLCYAILGSATLCYTQPGLARLWHKGCRLWRQLIRAHLDTIGLDSLKDRRRGRSSSVGNLKEALAAEAAPLAKVPCLDQSPFDSVASYPFKLSKYKNTMAW